MPETIATVFKNFIKHVFPSISDETLYEYTMAFKKCLEISDKKHSEHLANQLDTNKQ